MNALDVRHDTAEIASNMKREKIRSPTHFEDCQYSLSLRYLSVPVPKKPIPNIFKGDETAPRV